MQTDNKPRYRDRLAPVSAMLTLLSGLTLAFLSFFAVPVGEISSSVLWLLAQCLIYAGSIFGVTTYFNRKIQDFLN